MIHEVLKFIDQNLNDFLKVHFDIQEQIAITNNILNTDGAAPPNNQNKLVLTLLNISEENVARNSNVLDTHTIQQNKKQIRTFHLLLSSSFNDYLEGLRFLDAAYSYFEANTIFNETTSKNFLQDIDNIQLYFQSTSFEELHFIWTTLGAKYQPSFVCKVRIINK
jgi:Pvc16 N-terminal domain